MATTEVPYESLGPAHNQADDSSPFPLQGTLGSPKSIRQPIVIVNSAPPSKSYSKLKDSARSSEHLLPNQKESPTKTKGSKLWPTIVNLLNTCMGAGLLALPYAYAKAGFYLGIIMIFIWHKLLLKRGAYANPLLFARAQILYIPTNQKKKIFVPF